MDPRWRRLGWLAIAVAALAGVADLGGALVLDDVVAVEQSACVTGPLDLARIFGSNFWCEQQYFSIQSWRPLTVLLWWVVFRLGPATVTFTLLAIALHVGCVAVGLRLARELGFGPRAAAFGMLVFASLAIHAEALALVVGTADLATALLVLLCLQGFAAGRRWCVLPGIAAVLCKETGVLAVPLLATIAVLAPSRERFGGARGSAIVVGLVACAQLGLLAWRASVIGAWTGTEIPAFVNPIVDLGPVDRIVTGVAIVGRYHRVMLLGGPMSGDYAYDAFGVGGDVSIVDAIVGAACLLGWAALARSPALRVLAIWGLGTSVFVSNIPFALPAMFAERLFYLPSFAAALALGHAVDRSLASDRVRPVLIHVGIGAFVIAQLGLGVLHVLHFRDPEAIIRHTVETTPRNARARMWLGERLVEARALEEAREHLEAAAAIRPEWGRPVAVLAMIDDIEGRPQQAVLAFRRAMTLEPHDPQVAGLFIQFLLRYGHREPAAAVYDAHRQARGSAHPDVIDPRTVP